MKHKVEIIEYKGDKNERFILQTEGKNPLIVIGLNPSKANKIESDLTISKLVEYSARFKKDGLLMLNLSAEVKTNPNEMVKYLNTERHRKNITIIKKILIEYGQNCEVLACWGNSILKRDYLFKALEEINSLQKINWKKIGSLTMNDKGHPRHPSRTKYDIELTNFDINRYLITNKKNN